MKISYIKHAAIDKKKWDKCINEAPNGLIYAHSFFLDEMSGQWDALVLNGYEAVMPLTWGKKYSFRYLFQPFFTSALGIFGHINDEIITLFLNSIPPHFYYAAIDFKEGTINPDTVIMPGLQLKKRNNVSLDLNRPYKEINANYKRLATRMIKRAVNNKLEIVRGCPPEEVVHFYKKNYKNEHKNITPKDYIKFLKATGTAFKSGHAATYLAKINSEIIAAYLVLKDRHYIYSVIGGSNKKGKDCGAFYYLTDAAIKDYAGSNRAFRFEGSDIKGVAFFNSQFNPAPLHYYHLKFNRLPWPIKLFKK